MFYVSNDNVFFFFNNLGPPAIELKEFMEVEEGTDVNIAAKIKGVPFPTLTWFKAPPKKPDNKEPIVYDTHVNKLVVDDTCTLVIPQSRRSDTALYTITAVNNLGTASKEMRLNVLGKDDMILLKLHDFLFINVIFGFKIFPLKAFLF